MSCSPQIEHGFAVPSLFPVPYRPVEIPDCLVHRVGEFELPFAGIGVEIVGNVFPANIRPVHAPVKVFTVKFNNVGIVSIAVIS